MSLNILGFAVPLFIGFILLEYAVARRKGLAYFNLHNAIANISIGIAERLSDVFAAGVFYFIYDTVQKNYGLFEVEPGIVVWIFLFIATDLVWYWYHRLGHQVNIFWMAHIVHHQSEDFNLTVSARITIFQSLLRHGFWLILPFLGFPAAMITTILLIHGLYPFFVHTRLVGKLGILEYFLVTPSNHRVHHASNEKYLDKNYGDVLIIWDKIFGTFQKEEEEPVYGLTKPLKTYSFLWQHFHFCVELWLALKQVRDFRQKVKILLGKPDLIDENMRGKAERIFSIRKNETRIGKPLNSYVVWQMIILLCGLSGFILFEEQLGLPMKFGFAFLALLTLINCGAIMEQKRWVFYMEYIRLLVVFSFTFYLPGLWQVKLVVMTAALLFVSFYYSSLQRKYYRYVLK